MIAALINGLIEIHLLDVIDIFLVAILLYQLYNILKGTVAINIFFGIVAVYLIWKLVTALEMELLGEILGAFISVGFIALIVVFQPELRKFLLLLGTPSFMKRKRKRFLFWRININELGSADIQEIVSASYKMAASKTGGLIVLARRNELESVLETGQQLDAVVSSTLLENIFFRNSPLHDGAVVIFGDRIRAARCILPVSKDQEIPEAFGLRHRAAIGVTEQSDALAIVISEQTGQVSYAKNGRIAPGLKPVELEKILREDLR
jgi:uncharacterized protein (TIGR00159 family)